MAESCDTRVCVWTCCYMLLCVLCVSGKDQLYLLAMSDVNWEHNNFECLVTGLMAGS